MTSRLKPGMPVPVRSGAFSNTPAAWAWALAGAAAVLGGVVVAGRHGVFFHVFLVSLGTDPAAPGGERLAGTIGT